MRGLNLVRLAALAIVMGLALGGCTKCGWIWDSGSHACRSDIPVR